MTKCRHQPPAFDKHRGRFALYLVPDITFEQNGADRAIVIGASLISQVIL